MTTTEPARQDLRRRALDVLCSPALEAMVEMVLSSPAPDVFEARAVDGAVQFRRSSREGAWHFTTVAVEGRDPLGRQDAARFSPLAAETSSLLPERRRNSYPLAYERVAQLFDHPCAPDLCVIHTAAHRPSANRGEHGSLDVVQSRAPFIVSGAGTRRLGMVERHCRAVDVAPTILTLLGVEPGAGVGPTGVVTDGLLLSRQDGEPLVDLVDQGDLPDQVVAVLLDGANANVLYDMARRGEAPTVARLIEEGTAFAHGAIASLPTVTLANHTTLLTGAHPGHHGVLHNAWYDRSLARQVITESPATWQEATQWLFPGVETLHEALHRHQPGALSVSVNEPADRGADYSTFEFFRRGETAKLAEGVAHPPPHTTVELLDNEHYRFGTLADASGLVQAASLWRGRYQGRTYRVPRLSWISFSLTDAAMHEGGPHSEIARAGVRDTDARLGALLDAVDRRGTRERTAVVVVADHGMEENDAELVGDWGEALRDAGIEHRDEASGFLYLGDRPAEGDLAYGSGALDLPSGT